jgi:hypothetical protein
MALLGSLPDVDVASAELDEPGHRIPLIVQGPARQIEVNSVRADLRLRDRQEVEPEPRAVGRHETDPLSGLVSDLPAQRLSPEPRQTKWIVRIDAQRNEPKRHPASQHCSQGRRRSRNVA